MLCTVFGIYDTAMHRITDTKLFYILNDTAMNLQIKNDCAGTDPGLQTAGTDPGRFYTEI